MEPLILVVMGVSGSGKTTLGRALGEELELPFIEGDDFHSAANREKMAGGTPLTDEDRQPWLKTLHRELIEYRDSGRGCVLACSALKRKYRDILDGDGVLPVQWIHLTGEQGILLSRLEQRKGHYMPPSLLESQLTALEPPEQCLTLDTALSLEEKVIRVLKTLALRS